ncbi:MAG: hypothetical protein ACJA2E_002122 [Arenicella sp.]|jgi:hypothetical protein
MFPITQSRRLRNVATYLILYGLYSQSIYAADISSSVQQLETEPSIQTLAFSQDVSIIGIGDSVSISTPSPLVFTVSEKVDNSDGSYSFSAQSSSGNRLTMSGDKTASYGSISGEAVSYTITTDAQLGLI